MKATFQYLAILAILALMCPACGKSGESDDTKSIKIDDTQWNVEVFETVDLKNYLDFGDGKYYAPNETITVNNALKNTLANYRWLPLPDGNLMLVGLKDEPVINDKNDVIEIAADSVFPDIMNVTFETKDSEKWERVTNDNRGRNLAIVANGRLIAAPRIEEKAEVKKFVFPIPLSDIASLLPDVDLSALKQPANNTGQAN